MIIGKEKPKKLGEKPALMSLYHSWISHEVTRYWTRSSTVRSQRLTAWTMHGPNAVPVQYIVTYMRDYRRVRISDSIYWPLTGRTKNNHNIIPISTLYSSLLPTLVSSVYCSLNQPFLGNEF
jgi:hypothetical protein